MTLTDELEEKLQFVLQALLGARTRLTDWERGFVDDQVKRYDEYGSEMSLSAKQWLILDRIYEKVTA